MNTEIKPFDIAKHLETDDDFHDFLQEAFDTGTSTDYIHALNIAARAKGMTEVAKQAGVTRASLYKSLAENGNPGFETISRITEALGCKLRVA